MELREALSTAIAQEKLIRDHYKEGAASIQDPAGKRAFETLAREEQGHVDFLESRLAQSSAKGRGAATLPASSVPPRWWLEQALGQLRKTSAPRVADKSELELLKAALQLEQQTSQLYREFTSKLAARDRDLFAPFLEIEDGHVAIVQAELDAVQGLGYWFDMAEFALEAK